MSTFSDPQAVARYAEGPLRQVPGFLALQQMSHLLLAERVPAQGRVLVLGAGGGLELKAFAEAQPGWQLLGVDPAAPMLALAEQRLHTLRELRRRLQPGAPLVVAHHSVPQEPAGKLRWLQRYAAFAEASGVARADAQRAVDAIAERLPLLSPEQEVTLLQDAGFDGVELFYAGFSFRGWVAYAG